MVTVESKDLTAVYTENLKRVHLMDVDELMEAEERAQRRDSAEALYHALRRN